MSKLNQPVKPEEYCPHCREVTESDLVSFVSGTMVYCKQCHRFIEIIYDEED